MYQLEDYHVVWDTPGKDPSDSMPTGNGDIGLNVWTDPAGDVLVYLGKTDSWDENGRLLKVGRLRLHFDPSPFFQPESFRQELSLTESAVYLEANGFRLKIWVDANRPAVHLEGTGKQPCEVTAKLEIWRTEPTEMLLEDKRDGRKNGGSEGSHSESGLVLAGLHPVILPDTVADDPDSVIWYHRNETSIWAGELKHQGLGGFTETAQDPLLNLTSGGILWADHFEKQDGTTLYAHGIREFHICAALLTAQTDTAGEWLEKARELARQIRQTPLEQAYAQHLGYWKEFWSRSYIKLEAPGEEGAEAETITRMWHLQRYTVACAGRGAFPLKFNGSIFNVDGSHSAENPYCGQNYSADFRAWGGCYWFQNQRQIYWAMLASGDFECMLPFFRMYYNALPFSKYMTKKWFGHEGAFFPETMYFWGGYNRADYGLTPAEQRERPSDVESGYVKRYWQGGLELSFMMLEYFHYTGNQETFSELLYPVIREVLAFYDQHYPVGEDGKMDIEPAQCLETIWNAKNPLPEIAGLQAVLEALLDMPGECLDEAEKKRLRTLLEKAPPLNIGVKNGKRVILCCEEGETETHNQENISMYAVFPYKRYGLFQEDLETARETFAQRDFDTYYSCWHNNNVFAAYLGLQKDARKNLAKRYVLHHGYRFPTFYVDGDWVPDHDNGSVAQQTIQAMLVQSYRDSVLLFPAFPENWDAEFKLYTAEGVKIEAARKDGSVQIRNTAPSVPGKDIGQIDIGK